MATVLLEAELTPQMVTQAVRAMSEDELAALERELRNEKLRRLSEGALPQEIALLGVIQRDAPHDQHLSELREAKQQRPLSETEQRELSRLEEESEAFNVARVAATVRLSELRGVPFDELWQELVGAPHGPRRMTG